MRIPEGHAWGSLRLEAMPGALEAGVAGGHGTPHCLRSQARQVRPVLQALAAGAGQHPAFAEAAAAPRLCQVLAALRADVLTVALAATVLLQGLVWKSVELGPLIAVELEGVEYMKTAAGLPNYLLEELEWTSRWESLQATSRTCALVLVYKDACVLQAGVAAEESDGQPVSVDAAKLMGGSLCKENYLANLALYPGRVELSFLPRNTQVVKSFATNRSRNFICCQ